MPRLSRGKKAIGRRHKKHYERRTGEIRTEQLTQTHYLTEQECCQFPVYVPYPEFFLDECSAPDAPYNCTMSEEKLDPEGSSICEFYLIADKVIPHSPEIDVDGLYEERMFAAHSRRYSNILQQLRSDSLLIYADLKFILVNSSDIKFVQIYDGKIPGIKCSVTIERMTYRAIITVHRQPLHCNHDLWNLLPRAFDNVDDICLLLRKMGEFGVCSGNSDNEFVSMEPGLNAFLEQDFGAILGKYSYSQTIRHKDCKLLVPGSRCSKCMDLRGSLRKKKSMQVKKSECTEIKSPLSSRTPHSKMTKQQLCDKVNALQTNRYSLSAEVASLSRQLKNAILKSAEMSESSSSDIFDLVHECSAQVSHDFPDPNCFQRLFWSEQVKYNKAKQPSAMRWHPMIIKWCLQIKSRSTKAYETLRQIGCIKLPSSRTLFDYSHFMESKCGITPEIQKHLMTECKSKGMFDTSRKQFVGILHDELKIRQDLVYNKHTGELVGFVDLDRTANQLVEMQHQDLSGNNNTCNKLASHMLVVMVRGVATDLKYPLACFATQGITSQYLYSVVWKSVEVLEVHIGLKVMFVTCDGASANRKFIAMHCGGKLTHCTTNLFAPERNIYFISDAPHLLKTVRNCFSNSHSHTMSRKLWNNGKCISWMHIVDLFNHYVKDNLYTHCPKLTQRHIDLDAHSRMNVSLAAQVLSSTVAHALEHLYGDAVSETVKFIRLMDKFFDCVNTRSLYEGRNKRNVNLNPYTSVDDERLHWLLNDFLGYFKDWHNSVNNRKGEFSEAERQKMKLSTQTLEGLTITVKAIVDLVRFFLSEGVPFVLTTVFNQDPLEQYFGHCRHLGGAQENPTVNDVRHSVNRLRVMGSTALAVSGGNTKRYAEVLSVDSTPLSKRRKP